MKHENVTVYVLYTVVIICNIMFNKQLVSYTNNPKIIIQLNHKCGVSRDRSALYVYIVLFLKDFFDAITSCWKTLGRNIEKTTKYYQRQCWLPSQVIFCLFHVFV